MAATPPGPLSGRPERQLHDQTRERLRSAQHRGPVLFCPTGLHKTRLGRCRGAAPKMPTSQAATGGRGWGPDPPSRRRHIAMSRCRPAPSRTSSTLPRPQITQVATLRPPASDGAACSRPSTAGAKPESSEVIACTTSGGTQGASHSGRRRPSTPETAPDAASASVPAFETAHTATRMKRPCAQRPKRQKAEHDKPAECVEHDRLPP